MVLKMWSPYTRGFRVSSKILSPKHRSFLLNAPAKKKRKPFAPKKKAAFSEDSGVKPLP